MSDEVLAQVIRKIDNLGEAVGTLKGDIRFLTSKIEDYRRPCDQMLAHLGEHQAGEQTWREVKKSVYSWAVIGALTVVAGGLAFSLRNGWWK